MWAVFVYLLLIFKLLLIIIFGIYGHYHYKYWPRYCIPQIPPTLFTGNLNSVICMKKCSARAFQDMYNHPNAHNQPFVGIYIFHKPALLLRDPELIKRILIRDFSKFCDRYATSDVLSDPLGSRALFFIKNPAWKGIRNKLTSFFTSTRLKQMFPLIQEVGDNLNSYLIELMVQNDNNNSNNNNGKLHLDIKEICALYTTDVIATIAFGLQPNSFKQPNGSFRYNGREIFRFTTKRALHYNVIFFLPKLVSYIKATLVPQPQTEFFRNIINNVMADREQSGTKRNDLIDILIDFKKDILREHHTADFKLDNDIFVAQATIFFTAGFESTSNTMAFALYELAKSPKIQSKVRKEIKDALRINYETNHWNIIDKLEYMGMVLEETLRLYPPIPFLDRQYNNYNESIKYSLEPYHSYRIPVGMPVYVPVYALHHDPKYHANPYKFQPERFLLKNKQSIKPCTYLPFGLGPHACIGERLAILQSKVGLYNFLRNHRVELTRDNNGIHYKMKFDCKALILQSGNGIHLNIIHDPL